jgi:hypothetical protein
MEISLSKSFAFFPFFLDQNKTPPKILFHKVQEP